MKPFEFLEHTADVKFRIYGKSVEEIFEHCALALSSVFSRGQHIQKVKTKKITVECKDYESLLYSFIEEVIYLLDTKGFVVSSAKVTITSTMLTAQLYGDDTRNYSDIDQIKSPTYAQMYVKQKRDKTWEAQVVVDV